MTRPDDLGPACDHARLDEAEAAGALVFHAGTALQGDRLVTNGGRILGVTGLGFVQVDAGGDDVVDLVGYGLVILAALVGRTPGEKAEVIAHVADAMAPGALLLVRSARGLRTLLYPAVDPSALAGLEVLGTVHPTGEVINSVIVARTPLKER